MIFEFYGEVSAKCKKFLIKRQQLTNLFGLSIGVVIFAVVFIILAICYNPIYWFAFSGDLALLLFAVLPIDKKTLENLYPIKVYNEGDIVVAEGKNFYEAQNMSNIKCIKDYGDWYIIKFYVGYRSQRFICQKSNLIKGSIEEFENLFKNKLVK